MLWNFHCWWTHYWILSSLWKNLFSHYRFSDMHNCNEMAVGFSWIAQVKEGCAQQIPLWAINAQGADSGSLRLLFLGWTLSKTNWRSNNNCISQWIFHNRLHFKQSTCKEWTQGHLDFFFLGWRLLRYHNDLVIQEAVFHNRFHFKQSTCKLWTQDQLRPLFLCWRLLWYTNEFVI